MAEPTTWARMLATKILPFDLAAAYPNIVTEVALALDEARRQGIGEAAQSAQRQQINPPYTAAGFQSMIVGEILSLTTKEPTDG